MTERTPVASETPTKAEETRRTILRTALGLFMEEGYEGATMRKIAKEAGLSLGAAYYYFPSKEGLIHHYYEQTYHDQLEAGKQALTGKRSLETGLAAVLRAHMEAARPYHSLSRALLRTAIDPAQSISPFSAESKDLRLRNIALFEDLLQHCASSIKGIPARFRERLPELLWLFKMGIILYWVYDRSPAQEKTFRLIDASAGWVARVVGLTKLPGVKSIAQRGVEMFDEFKPYE